METAAPAIDLARPRNLGGLLDATFSLWGRNLAAFLALSFVIVGPISIAVAGIGRAIGPDLDRIREEWDAAPAGQFPDLTITNGLVAGLVAIAVLSFVQAPLVTATHARAVLQLSQQPAIGFVEALKLGLRVLPMAVLAELVATLLTALAAIPLLIPAVYVGVRLTFAAQAAAVDRQGIWASVTASWRTVRGSWWRTFGILLLFGLMALIANGLFTSIATAIARSVGLGSLSLAITIVGQAVTASVSALATTLLFFDLRARQTEVEQPAW
jgi:hypothetical protein